MSKENIFDKDDTKSRTGPEVRRAVEMPPVKYGVPPKQVPVRTQRFRKPPGPKPSKKT